MTNNRCDCPKCLHRSCPPPHAEPPYDELTQQIDDNILSVKIPKHKGHFQSDDSQEQEKRSFDFNCADEQGEKCKPGCTKVHVVPDQQPPPKRPAEEMLFLRSIRHTLPNDDLMNTLEIEFKAPRNYIPLPELGPTPPIIVPKQNIRSRRRRKRKK
ncbi:uncharacterized protein LOC105662004 [Megachile rotundata]|uniref:uncharacterized protein LOC105662004 n=1 Tax=Megachile rotundata TaxID=143995 RepID=UPI000614EB86|nr:PREDICTED: uncharacterized protein LOC105662004 [Megachile rotundata]